MENSFLTKWLIPYLPNSTGDHWEKFPLLKTKVPVDPAGHSPQSKWLNPMLRSIPTKWSNWPPNNWLIVLKTLFTVEEPEDAAVWFPRSDIITPNCSDWWEKPKCLTKPKNKNAPIMPAKSDLMSDSMGMRNYQKTIITQSCGTS